MPAEGLLAELQGDGWTLVEFWGPDNLFCRLMAPVRAQVPRSHGGRLRLRCCIVATPAQYEACARWRVRLLPDLVLFRGARRVRRWGSGVDVRVLRRDLDALLGSADA